MDKHVPDVFFASSDADLAVKWSQELSVFRITIIAMIFLLSACSASGPRYSELPKEPLNGRAEIIVYRLSQIAASGGCYRVEIDDSRIGILANGGYLRQIVEPGKHKVSIVLREDLDLEIETKPNETNYRAPLKIAPI